MLSAVGFSFARTAAPLARIGREILARLRRRRPPPVPAGPVLRLDYGSGDADKAVSPGGRVTLYGEVLLSPSPSCDVHYLLVSVPEGWVVPGRGLLSRGELAAGIFGRDGEGEEISLPEEAGDRYLLLRFISSGPPGLDGFLHFTYVNGAVIAYDPGTGAATFTVIFQTSWLTPPGSVPVTARAFSLLRPDQERGPRLRATEGTDIAVAVGCAEDRGTPLEVEYLADGEVFFPEGPPAGPQPPASSAGAGSGRDRDGVRLDFPALGRGERVIALTFQAPDPDKGRVFYNGAPAPVDSGGRIALGGDFFQPERIAFRAAQAWKGVVRLGFLAVVRHDPSGAEREVPGSVVFFTARGSRRVTVRRRTPADSAARRVVPPTPDPSLYADFAEEGSGAADDWSAFSRLRLSDCLAQDAEEIDVALLPRRAYVQEYRVFSGTMADEAVPLDVLRTDDSSPGGFRLGGLEYMAALLEPDEDFLPLPVVAAYALPQGSFLPGGGVFGGFAAQFPPAPEEVFLPARSPRTGFGGEDPLVWEEFLTDGGDVAFPPAFPLPEADGGGERESFAGLPDWQRGGGP